jgi:hypothetical protein
MATENFWGAPPIYGELLRLGFEVSKRSVSRYLANLPRTPRARQNWTTFLRNHRDGIAAMDFFFVPTAMFRVRGRSRASSAVPVPPGSRLSADRNLANDRLDAVEC